MNNIKRKNVTIARTFFSILAVIVLGLASTGARAAATISFEPAELQLEAGESQIVEVWVKDIPPLGLAAFQLDLKFAPAVIDIVNPNEDFRTAGIIPFAPLGGDSRCTAVRGTTPCPDPPWFLTSTGRAPVCIDRIDNDTGKVQFGCGTSGPEDPPVGDGVIALIKVVGQQNGITLVNLENVILADKSELPTPLALTVLSALKVMVGPLDVIIFKDSFE